MTRPMRNGFFDASSRGFTLLEVLAAVAVMSLAFVTLLAAEGLSLRRAAHASRLLDASQAARERMEQVLDSGSDAAAEGSVPGGFVIDSAVSDTEYEGLAEARVTVRWKEGEREEAFDLVAFFLR